MLVDPGLVGFFVSMDSNRRVEIMEYLGEGETDKIYSLHVSSSPADCVDVLVSLNKS